jgi:hypothetical protein
MQTILNYMKARGEQLDTEIAAATRMSLADVRTQLSELSARGDLIVCHATRFNNGKKSKACCAVCRATSRLPALAENPV